ncbi:MAG: DUF2235 domain-containing protein [Verrucomicrobiota bacterium]
MNAYQALAVDERRVEFPQTLWTPPAPPVAGQVLEQAWFSGVHCDVGGGYPETGLSDITFSWMAGKAQELGLQLDPNVAAQYALLEPKFAIDQIHESWNVLWLFPKSRTITNNATLGNSVAIRCQHDNIYQPSNLNLTHNVPAASYPLVQVVAPPVE